MPSYDSELDRLRYLPVNGGSIHKKHETKKEVHKTPQNKRDDELDELQTELKKKTQSINFLKKKISKKGKGYM